MTQQMYSNLHTKDIREIVIQLESSLNTATELLSKPEIVDKMLESVAKLEKVLDHDSIIINALRYTTCKIWHGMLEKELFERENT